MRAAAMRHARIIGSALISAHGSASWRAESGGARRRLREHRVAAWR